MVNAVVVNIGTELTTGLRVNTNLATLSKEIHKLGGKVLFGMVVGDNKEAIERHITYALQHSDIVITTGGLGPTHDDVTKEAIASVCGKKLIFSENVWKNIKKFIESHKLTVNEEYVKNQAFVVEGSTLFPNKYGTAPGLAVKKGRKYIVALPGVPWEMKSIWKEGVTEWWKSIFGSSKYYVKVLHTSGLKESEVSAKIKELLNEHIGILASPGKVDIFITAETKELEDSISRKVSEKLSNYIFGIGNELLEEVIGKILREKGLTLCIAESCTGGMLSHRITNIPGSSDYFLGGIISYHTATKEKLLNVSSKLIDNCGIVSTEVATAMSEGVKSIFGANIGIGITGVAGPSGSTEDTPVGTVCIAISFEKTVSERYHFIGNRLKIKEWATNMALHKLWRTISG